MPQKFYADGLRVFAAPEKTDTGEKMGFLVADTPQWVSGAAEEIAKGLNLISNIALLDVAMERHRQKEIEGWTDDHDDKHEGGQLSSAALNYVAAAAITISLGAKKYETTPPLDRMGHAIGWPWMRSWWKPGTARRMLVKAAALIIAEIERLDRKEKAND